MRSRDHDAHRLDKSFCRRHRLLATQRPGGLLFGYVSVELVQLCVTGLLGRGQLGSEFSLLCPQRHHLSAQGIGLLPERYDLRIRIDYLGRGSIIRPARVELFDSLRFLGTDRLKLF